tara:strand:+ start:65066 stop:68638 length:3573 start_codon:yes stop_codon:yes gene_type:complete
MMLLLCSCYSVCYGQSANTGEQYDSLFFDKNILTDEEKKWVAAHPVIKATSKNATAPNEFIRGGEPVGFSVDYLNLVAQNVGLEIEYVHGFSWGVLLHKLENREIDISHNIFKNEEREKYLNFTNPYMDLEPAFFGRVGSDAIETIDNLNGKKIGVVKGWSLNNEYKENYPDLNFIELDTSIDAALALSNGDIDLYITTLLIGNTLVEKNFITNVEVVGRTEFLKITNNNGARIAIRNDWPQLLKIMEKGMAAITEQQISALNQKWLMPAGGASVLPLTADEISWLRENPVIKVAADPSILPIEFINENGKISGISGAYLDIIDDKLGVEFRWIGNQTFDEGMAKIRSKEADMLSSVSPSPERSDYLIFTEGFMTVNSAIFAREGEKLFGDMEGLDGYSVAMAKGFISSEWLRRNYPNIEVIEAPSKVAALELVSTGVADAHIGSVATTSHNLAVENITNLVVVGVTPFEAEIVMGVRSELPLLASIMQKALKSISDEERAAINRQWIVLNQPEIRQDYKLIGQIIVAAAALVILILIWNYSLRQEVRRRKFSEERFRQIAETVEGVFFVCSADLRNVNYVSPIFEEWTGKKCQKLYDTPTTWIDIIHPDDRTLFRDAVERAIGSDYSTRFPDYRIIDAQNKTRWLTTQVHPIRSEDGKVQSIVGFMNDITTSIESRAKLTEISNQFQNAFHHASHGMALISLEGQFIRVNDALCRILGYNSEEMLKLNIKTVSHSDDLKISTSLMGEVIDGKRQSFQLQKQQLCSDGSYVHTQLNVSMVRDDVGNPVHFVAQIQDLSELKEREEQLRHSQKMDAVGKLTGGIAHDFNNILGIILGNLEILKTTMPEEPSSALRLEKAISGVDRGSNLIKKLLSFSRKTSSRTGPVNVNDVIGNLSEFIKRSFTVSINVQTVLENDIWPAEVDGGDLEDAILNLTLNARDAMNGGGDLIIETKNVVLGEQYVDQNPGSRLGDHIEISVRDNGEGIAPELIDKILEPFFTTKPVNKGTGLGLSMVHGFIQRSKGHMRIYSDVNCGTTIKLFIPRSGKKMSESKLLKRTENKLPKGNETILIVDDEKHLCEVAQAQLTDLGYSVYTANNASNALELLSKIQKVDLLFSDIVMPDNLDGYEMASSALQIQPTLKILLTTGFSQNLEENIKEEDKILASLAHNMLHKPYNQHELAMAIRKSLDV